MIRWRCAKSSLMKSPCILITDLNIDCPTFLSIEHDHVHEANENMLSAVKIIKNMKAKATITNDTPSQFFSSAILNVPNSVLAELPREDYLKRSIRNHREYKNLTKPRCLSEIIVEGEYKEYGQERFLLYDHSQNTCSERIIMFATDIGLTLLAGSDTWFSDGNFGLAPEFFKQLYIIGDEDIVYLYSKWLEHKGKLLESMKVRDQFDRNKVNTITCDDIVMTFVLENKHGLEDTIIGENVMDDLFACTDDKPMDLDNEMDPADDDIFSNLFLD